MNQELDKTLKYDNNIPGWTNELELNWLFETSQTMDSILEIGSWKGRSAHALLSGCQGRVWAVDHFQGSRGEEEIHKEAREKDIFQEFLSNLSHFKNLKVLKMPSLKAAQGFKDKSLDMIFIDGGHLYPEVKADILAWLPKAKKLICGHDYNYFSVKQAVDEILGKVETVQSIWIKSI